MVLSPKKSRFSGPTPSNAPSNDVARLKTIKYKRHIYNRYIGNFMYTSVVALLCVVVCRGVGCIHAAVLCVLCGGIDIAGRGGLQSSPSPSHHTVGT